METVNLNNLDDKQYVENIICINLFLFNKKFLLSVRTRKVSEETNVCSLDPGDGVVVVIFNCFLKSLILHSIVRTWLFNQD